MQDRLVAIASKVLKEAMGLQPGERILVVGNPEEASRLICDAYFQAAVDLGAKPLLARQPAKKITDTSDPGVLAALASEPDVLLSISTDKIGKDPHGLHIGYVGRDGHKYDHIIDKLAYDHRLRYASSPGIAMDTYLNTLEVDYGAMKARATELKAAIQRGSEVRIETPAGTQLTVGIRGREIFVDDGDYTRPGTHGNLPCGEVFFSPQLGTARGRIVFDGVIAMGPVCVFPSEPVVMEVDNGYVTRILPGPHSEAIEAAIKGGEARALELGKPDYAKNAWGVGEVGLGLNPAARMVPDMLEAEKVGGTCHVAIGSNYDKDMPAITHFDMLMTGPHIRVDGKPLPRYE